MSLRLTRLWQFLWLPGFPQTGPQMQFRDPPTRNLASGHPSLITCLGGGGDQMALEGDQWEQSEAGSTHLVLWALQSLLWGEAQQVSA